MKIDPFRVADRIPVDRLRRRALDVLLNVTVPFNRWLGFRLLAATPERVEVLSPEAVLRRNHVGGAHACALALMGEYPAGILIAQRFPIESYRVIIGELRAQYHKQGRGALRAEALAPSEWPELDEDGQAWVEMQTRITNGKGELVAECFTKWQIKEWRRVRGAGAPAGDA
jgi:acyl-coenzyme A thioesterase PaaI-like protein